MRFNRRNFLKGCCAGIVAMNGAKLHSLVFGQGTPQRDIVISVFLRGGTDALNLLVPADNADYLTARPNLSIPAANVLPLDATFGLHPAAAKLKELYDAQHLAPVCAAGSTDPTRSHFEAQDFMERGVPGDPLYSGGGWISRYLAGVPGSAIFKGVSMGSSVALALDGFDGALAMNGAEGFTLNGNSLDDVRRGLRRMYSEDPQLAEIMDRTLDATDYIDYADPGTYVPSPGVTYPADNDLADTMKSLAQIIKLDLGLSAATVDLGGWDTHDGQRDWDDRLDGRFADLVQQLSDAIHAFWLDMAAYHGRLTIVVMSEFGRRLRENDNRGTDHGHGGAMFVVSSSLVQKKVRGTWPGLAYENLFENVDLAVTTDFRTVLSEIMYARLGVPNVGALFPGFSYPGPVGFFGASGNGPAGTAQFQMF